MSKDGQFCVGGGCGGVYEGGGGGGRCSNLKVKTLVPYELIISSRTDQVLEWLRCPGKGHKSCQPLLKPRKTVV